MSLQYIMSIMIDMNHHREKKLFVWIQIHNVN